MYVDPLIAEWIVALVRATREMSATAVGASVRGSLALERAVRGWALLHGREYVVPTDVERLFVAVLGHRVVLTPTKLAEARQRGMAAVMRRPSRTSASRSPRRRSPSSTSRPPTR